MKPALILASIALNLAATECRVIDPELQGTYQGGCDSQGLARGSGLAQGKQARYEGEFKAGKKHGEGLKTWLASGDSYRGLFIDDFRHGWGHYRWGEQSPWAGEEFEGDYIRDQRSGHGVYFFKNGDKFAGLWRADMRYGQTFMESRREGGRTRAIAALDKPGMGICREARFGTNNMVRLRGSLEIRGEKQWFVLLDEESQRAGLYNSPKPDISAELERWQPCSA